MKLSLGRKRWASGIAATALAGAFVVAPALAKTPGGDDRPGSSAAGSYLSARHAETRTVSTTRFEIHD